MQPRSYDCKHFLINTISTKKYPQLVLRHSPDRLKALTPSPNVRRFVVNAHFAFGRLLPAPPSGADMFTYNNQRCSVCQHTPQPLCTK